MSPDAEPEPRSAWPTPLRSAFSELETNETLWVALSGGLDSSFLLAAAAVWSREQASPVRLRALHVHHGLHPDADAWAQYSRQLCDRFQIPLSVRVATVEPAGEGLEMAARKARYAIFRDCLNEDDQLLLGHHADDQAETVLYRLMRGSGVRGLAGMPVRRRLGSGWLIRPLLGLSRARIRILAERWGIDGCVDPANRDTRFDRNFLRHEIVPRLKDRWPGVEAAIGRAAGHCRETEALLEALAREDLRGVDADAAPSLDLVALQKLPPARRCNLLRHWLRHLGARPPGEKRLREGLSAIAGAGPERQPRVCWRDGVLTRYRDRLFFLRPGGNRATPAPVDWTLDRPLVWGDGCLRAEVREGDGLHIPGARVRVSARQGGERLNSNLSTSMHRPLKKWLQEQGIPPWQRGALPLLWFEGQLVAVADLWVDPRMLARPGERGWRLRWCPDANKGKDEGLFD